MTTYGISKFLFAFNTDPALRQRFKDTPALALSAFPLTDEERQALEHFEFRSLYERGVHPLLLSALANGSGIPIPQLVQSLQPDGTQPTLDQPAEALARHG